MWGGHYHTRSHLLFRKKNVFQKSPLSLLMLCSNACRWQDSRVVTHSKGCGKTELLCSPSVVLELPQTLGNAVAVRHQSRAAGLTPKNNSTSNAVSFPWFVLFQTWSLCICLDSVIIHACVCTVWARWSRDMKYMSIWHVRKHNFNFFALMSELDHHDNLYSWMFLKVYAIATAVLSWPWSITVSCRT